MTFKLLECFTDEEIANHIKVQKMLNQAYVGDIERSKEKFNIY